MKHVENIVVNPYEILFAHYGWHPDSVFWNARRTFGEVAFKELYENIKHNGLTHEITIRTYAALLQDKMQVVCGERRLRVILSLLDENCTCYDKITRSWKPAKEVYQSLHVKCEYECDDTRAIKISYGENGARDDLSDYDNMQYCYELRSCQKNGEPVYDLKAIGELLDKSITWVSQSLSFLGLPDRAKEMLRNGDLTRSAALYCLKIDRNYINKYLDFVIATIEKKKQEEEVKFDTLIGDLKDQLEINHIQFAVSQKTGADTTKLTKAKDQLKTKLNEAKGKKRKTSGPRLTPNDMQAIAKQLNTKGKKGKSIVLSHKQIRQMRNELMSSSGNYRHEDLAIHILNLCLGESEEDHIIRILEKYII